MKLMICTIHSWNISNAFSFQKKYEKEHIIEILTQKEELTPQRLAAFQPDYIFFPHWSDYIPKEIYTNYQCIVFHMADLPFGRGGSPLQNHLARGIYETKLSALRVEAGLDSGPIYQKVPLSLYGTAEEIYQRVSKLIFETMIPFILEHEITPSPQTGDPVVFPRRTPEESRLLPEMTLKEVFDTIRMLDAPGYPKAFLTLGNYRLTFSRAALKENKIIADVEIMEEPLYESSFSNRSPS